MLNPVRTSNNIQATLSNATMSNVASTKSNDNVAGLNRALAIRLLHVGRTRGHDMKAFRQQSRIDVQIRFSLTDRVALLWNSLNAHRRFF